MSFFQLRLKKESFKKKLIIGRKIKKICKKFNVKFLINDDVYLAKKLNADGCHLGQRDMNINNAIKFISEKFEEFDGDLVEIIAEKWKKNNRSEKPGSINYLFKFEDLGI